MGYVTMRRGMSGLGDLISDAKTEILDTLERHPSLFAYCTSWHYLEGVEAPDDYSLYWGIGNEQWSAIADRWMNWIKNRSGGIAPDAPWKNNITSAIASVQKTGALIGNDGHFYTGKTFFPNCSRGPLSGMPAKNFSGQPAVDSLSSMIAGYVSVIAQRAVQRRAEALAMVNRIFTELLGRTLAGQEAENWINRVLGEGLTEPQVRQIILDSQEYKDKLAGGQTPAQQTQAAAAAAAAEAAKKSFASVFSLEFLKSPILWVGVAVAGGLYYWTQVKNKSMAQIPYVGQYLVGGTGRKRKRG